MIYFKPDKRIFVLFSALQLSEVKFYKSLENRQLSSLTKRLRRYFKYEKIPSLDNLNKYFRKMHPYYLNQWILHHGNPPSFRKIAKKWQLEAPLKVFHGFNKELKNFFRETKIEKLFWNTYRQKALSLKTKYLNESRPFFKKTIKYLRTGKKPLEIVIIPNLFDAIGSGYGLEIGRTIYVIFSPAERRSDLELIIHEFLHNLVELKEGERIDSKILKKLKIGRQAAVYYKDKKIILAEYLIRAITGRIFHKAQEKNYAASQIKKGFTNIDYFLKILKDYEKRRQLNFNRYIGRIFS